jgi:choline dehydrogenase-like flavoprotein
MTERQYDVVIVGAGISGALIAWEMVQAGYSVLMLEAGPDKTTLADRNLLVENFYQTPQKTPESPYPEVVAAPKATTVDLYEVPYRGHLDQEMSEFFNTKDYKHLLETEWCELTQAQQDTLCHANQTRNDWFKSTYERRVGGTTWHWLGTCLRLVPGDFEMVTRFSGQAYYDRLKVAGDTNGLALAHKYPLPTAASVGLVDNLPYGFVDWPFSYQDMKPWYTKAEREMGVSGDPFQSLGGADRLAPDGGQEPFPMPVVPTSIVDKTIAQAADDLEPRNPDSHETLPGFKGFLMQVESTPQGRNSVGGYQGRPQCCGNSSCIPICPIQAKYDATVHVNLCRQHYGKLFTLMPQTVASEVLLDAAGANVTGVRCKTWTGTDCSPVEGQDFKATGRIYIMAAHAIETPKLLLNSTGGPGVWGRRGVANSSDVVGRYLMDHNTSLSYALACDPVYPVRGPGATSGIESLKDNNARGFAGTFRVEIGNWGWEWPDDAPFTQGYNHARNSEYGMDLRTKLKQEVSRQFRFAALVEPTPDPSHRVTLSASTDFLGIPRPKIKYGISDDPYSIRGYVNSLRVHQYIFQQMKASNINHQAPQDFAGAGHIMGTCRMGTDPKTSVVNPNQQSHDHENLYIVGSSVFPTVGASNPTLTIGALSLWAAQNIKDQLKSM